MAYMPTAKLWIAGAYPMPLQQSFPQKLWTDTPSLQMLVPIPSDLMKTNICQIQLRTHIQYNQTKVSYIVFLDIINMPNKHWVKCFVLRLLSLLNSCCALLFSVLIMLLFLSVHSVQTTLNCKNGFMNSFPGWNDTPQQN